MRWENRGRIDKKRTKDKRNIAGKRWKIDEMDRKGLKWEEGERRGTNVKEERREGNKTSGKKASSLTERERRETCIALNWRTEGRPHERMNEWRKKEENDILTAN